MSNRANSWIRGRGKPLSWGGAVTEDDRLEAAGSGNEDRASMINCNRSGTLAARRKG